MKILQLGKAYPPVNLGGVEVVIAFLTEGLNKFGYSCDALGVNDTHSFVMQPGKFGGNIYRTKLVIKAFSTLFSLQLVNYLNHIKNNYDVIHIHSPDPMAAIALFICNPKAKIVLHWHSDILKQKILLVFYKPLLNWLLKRADLILSTSPNYIVGSSYLSKHISKTKVLPIGLDIIKEELPSSFKENLSKAYEGKKIIFSLGRLAYYKGFDYLILAALHLPDNCMIVIAGEGDNTEKKRLSILIESNNLSNKVRLIGKVSEHQKQWFFENATLFALSSIYKTEAFAIVQVEALSYGLPIVSTRIEGSGVDWVNQHGSTGITVPIKDEKALATALIKLIDDEELYRQTKKNALERYVSIFTADAMIKRQITYYEELFSKKPSCSE